MAKASTTRKKAPKKTPAKRTSAKRSTTRKKTTSKARGSKASTARKQTKKATPRASTSSGKGAARKTKREMTTKKTTRKKSAAKKTTAKKSTSKKKTTKKTAAATAKKRTTSKKKTSSKKKPTAKKKTSTRKKKSTAKGGAKSAVKAAAAGDAGANAEPKKTVKKKRQGKADRKRGRSVAEVASTAAADAQGYVFINGRRVRMISTAGRVIPKKPRVQEVVEPAVEAAAAKQIKTKLSRKELNHYRSLLLIKRAELVGDLTAMEAAALRSNGGDISHMPIHMADIGSDTFDQDFNLGLAENERQHLREIDDALSRIEDKTYGVCQMTGKDIPKARLDAKPWAKYTIEAARLVEAQTQR